MNMCKGCFFPAFLSLLLLSCKSAPAANGKNEQAKQITLAEFNELDWQRQVESLEGITSASKENDSIIGASLSDDDDAVVIAGLECVLRLERDEFLPVATELLKSPDPIIRWRALLIVEKLSSDPGTLPKIARLTNDKEWLVREAAYRTMRKFKDERKEKKFFYPVIFHLSEKNPQVVAEIYRTLVWYDDDSAWPYLIKRSYHCKSAAELILVMRELARTKTREAQVRLKTLTRSQSVIVRQEAALLLREYF